LHVRAITIFNGNYTIDGSVTIDGTIYATGDIYINSGQSISGSGTLVAGGTFEINNITGLVGGASSKLFLYAMGDDIHFNNCVNETANCIFYSPDHGLKFNNVNNVSINGASM